GIGEVPGARTPPRQQGRDDSPGATPDIDVEATPRAVQPFLEGRERSHLVHTADHATAGKGQRVPWPVLGPQSREGPMYELHANRQSSKGPANPGPGGELLESMTDRVFL